jgi:hypothetical protein
VPHLIEAHELLVPAFLEQSIPEPILGEVVELVSCLCHPNPSRRGHSRNVELGLNQFGLERVISKFNILATKAKVLPRGA